MKPATYRRASTVLAADFAACSIVAMAMASTRLLLTLVILAGINTAAAVALPAPGVVQAGRLAGRLAGRALRAGRAWTRRPAPPDPQTGHAAWMARVQAIADQQAHSGACGCEGMCSCRIPLEDWKAFCAELDLISRAMREWGRGR